MRKFISFILCFYFVLLSVHTCTDELRDDDGGAAHVERLGSSTWNHERLTVKYSDAMHDGSVPMHHEDGTDDTCPPLCICSCCSAAAVIEHLHETPGFFASPLPSSYSASPAPIPGRSVAIWNPPRLA